MTVTMVREEDPKAPVPVPPALRLVPPMEPSVITREVVEAPPPPVQAPAPPPARDNRQAINVQALAVTIALANVLSVRFSLILTIMASAVLTGFAEAQPEHQLLAVVAAGLFTLLALIPIVALAHRKG